MKRYLDRLLPAVIIAVISWTLYANSQGSNSPGSRVTVVNPLSSPAIVTCANCGQISVGSISGTFTSTPTTVTIANSAAFPAIVSLVNVPNPLTVTCANCATSTASVAGALNVTITNQPYVNITPTGSVTVSNANPNGQASMANSQPVVIASDQSTLVITCTNCASGAFNGQVTVANSAAFPAIVSCTNCGAATISGLNVTGPFNVTVTNVNANGIAFITQSSPVVIASNQPGLTIANAITILNSPANPVIALVTVSNTATQPAIVSCTNCGAASVSVSGPFNVTITNSITLSNTAAAPAIVSLVNIPTITLSNPVLTSNVTVTNTNPNGQATMANSQSVAIASNQTNLGVTVANTASAPVVVSLVNIPIGVTVANTASAPAIISMVNIPGISGPITVSIANTSSVAAPVLVDLVTGNPASGGLTMISGYNQLTNVNSLKTSAGKLHKVVCMNKSNAPAFIEIFNLTPTSVTQNLLAAAAGGNTNVAKPILAYGIPTTTNTINVMNETGDQFTVAMSAVATLTIGGALPPTVGIDCNFSIE